MISQIKSRGRQNQEDSILCKDAQVVKLVYTPALGAGPYRGWRFKSSPGHQTQNLATMSRDFMICGDYLGNFILVDKISTSDVLILSTAFIDDFDS